MRLIECYIENFGKLCKQNFTFNKGFNCICQNNGEGKTTLSVFIKVMLFGMSDTKKTSLYENERRRYLPWNGGVCGGYLVFEAGGKSYRVERTFAPKPADDSFTLYDVSRGGVSRDFTENLGEELFGIDADGFERTVFLSERNLSVKSDNKSISAKLSDLVGTDGDIGVMDDAMKVLDEGRRFYQKRGGSGKISDIKAQITDTELKLGELSEIEKALAASDSDTEKLSAQMRELTAQIGALMTERGEAMVARSQSAGIERQKAMRRELGELVARKDRLIEFFGGEAPSFAEIDEANLQFLRAKQLNEIIESESSLGGELDELGKIFEPKRENLPPAQAVTAATERALNRARAEMSEKGQRRRELFRERVPEKQEIEEAIRAISEKRGSTIKAVFIALSVIFALGAAALGILVSAYAFTLLLPAVIFAALAFTALKTKATDEFFASVYGSVPPIGERLGILLEMSANLGEVNDCNSDEDDAILTEFAERIGVEFDINNRDFLDTVKGYADYERLYAGNLHRVQRQNEMAAEAKLLTERVKAFLARFKTSGADPFGSIRAAINEYTEITAKIVTYRAELENGTVKESDAKPGRSIEEIDRERMDLELKRENCQKELGGLMRRREEWESALLDKDMLTAQNKELRDRLAEAEDTLKTILLTQKYLEIAKDSITAKYLGKTKASFEKYVDLISAEAGQFGMDTSFGVTKIDGGASRPIDAYSRGTRELYTLASRLALTDSLYEGERPFVVFDDPFCTFDDDKTSEGLKVLRELGAERQVIYFTCSPSRT